MNSAYRMKLCLGRGLFAVLLSAGAAALFACSVDVAPPPPQSQPCGEDDSVSCTHGVGWSCPPHANPEDDYPELLCSDAVDDGSRYDFCCWER